MDELTATALEPGASANPEPGIQPTEQTPMGQPTQTATVEKPNFYSPEEIESLLTQDVEVDTTRLSPEGRLLMKSFQKGFTPKLMERTELKREIENLRKEVASSKQPATVEEMFDRDPEGTLRYIDQEMSKHRTRLDGVDALDAVKHIEELRSVKDNLLLRGINQSRKMGELNRISAEAQGEVLRAIPDFDKKEPILTDFAIKELGYSIEDIRFLTDPTNTGKYASKFIMQINKTYEIANAQKTAALKQVKIPPKQEAAGTGGGDDQGATYKTALKRAMETGDWTDVLKMKGTIQRLAPGGG